MTVDEVIAKLPHKEADLDALLAELGQIARLSKSAMERAERLNEEETVSYANGTFMHLYLSESTAYDCLLNWLIAVAMKIAFPSLKVETPLLAATIRERGCDVTCRQVIGDALAHFGPTADQDALAQLLAHFRGMLSWGACHGGSVRSLVAGRTLRLQYASGESLILKLVRLVHAKFEGKSANAIVIDNPVFERAIPVGREVEIGSEYLISAKRYRNGRLDIKCSSSDVAYRVAELLIGSGVDNEAAA